MIFRNGVAHRGHVGHETDLEARRGQFMPDVEDLAYRGHRGLEADHEAGRGQSRPEVEDQAESCTSTTEVSLN
jgi:hypothetical protein